MTSAMVQAHRDLGNSLGKMMGQHSAASVTGAVEERQDGMGRTHFGSFISAMKLGRVIWPMKV